MDKTKQKCRGKWKEHGELITTADTNGLNLTVIQKKCVRCGRYVYWECIPYREWWARIIRDGRIR